MSRIYSDPRPQYFKEDGITVNSNGKLYFWQPGPSTTTPKPVYSDIALTIDLTNPVNLDANGRAPAMYLNGDYNVQHVEVTATGEVQIWRVDYYEPPYLQ